MTLSNMDIRNAAKENNVKHWQIAQKIGIGEVTLCRRLRNELPEAEKEKIFNAIYALAASNNEQ